MKEQEQLTKTSDNKDQSAEEIHKEIQSSLERIAELALDAAQELGMKHGFAVSSDDRNIVMAAIRATRATPSEDTKLLDWLLTQIHEKGNDFVGLPTLRAINDLALARKIIRQAIKEKK